MKILNLEQPIIRKKLKPVSVIDQSVKTLIEKMRQTVEAEQDPEGVGLAANQVGIDQRLFLAKIGKTFEPFINPEILEYGKEIDEQFEGCLSIPDLFGFVKRPKEVTVKYTTPEGKAVTKTLKGMPARIIQHEMDHLNGRLFIDHVAAQTRELFRYLGHDDKGEPQFEKLQLN